MIPRVYVAGASGELERAERWISALQVEGIEVTYDWTPAVRQYGSVGASKGKKCFYARSDLRGIDEAHLLWLLAPGPGVTTVGAWIETGYALSQFMSRARRFGRDVVVTSPPISPITIFAELPVFVEHDTDQQAFDWILGKR